MPVLPFGKRANPIADRIQRKGDVRGLGLTPEGKDREMESGSDRANEVSTGSDSDRVVL